MRLKIKNCRYIFGLVLIFLILSNPSLNSFKDFIGLYPEVEANNRVRRSYNFFIFSTYQEAHEDNFGSSLYYIGIADNFFQYYP